LIAGAALTLVALALLSWVLVLKRGSPELGIDLRFLPALNAALNTACTCFLASGYVAIRRGNVRLHQRLMVSALVASMLFLVGYLAYHYVHGDTKYPGSGAIKAVYLLILATHVLLSIAMVPLVLTTVFFAARRRFPWHRKVARITLPIWLYVSVTGVVIFFMLRGAAPAVP
jgi:putative membrane protein